MDVKIDSVFQEIDGRISVHATISEAGYDSKSICVQGRDEKEIEAGLRAKIASAKAAIEAQAKNASLRQMVEDKVATITSELSAAQTGRS